MKKAGINAKVIISLVLLALAFFCSMGVTYSYFTATANKQGTLTFPDLDVRFIAKDETLTDYPTGDYTQDGLYTINLYPVGGTISRGQEFELSLSSGGTAIQSLRIHNMTNSTNAYVRFWIDAYITDSLGNVDKTTNYGKYFFLTDNEAETRWFSRGGGTVGTGVQNNETSWCYYGKYAMGPNGNLFLGNTLNFKDVSSTDAIPNEVLGSKLNITMTLEAVQSTHQAFKSVFNDEKGYLSSWT